MKSWVAKVTFTSNKSCFVGIPKSWVQNLSQDKLLVFELSNDNVSVFVSWAGDITTAKDGEDILEVSGLFGNKLGLKDGDQVVVKPVSVTHPCTRVHVEPLSVDDWEILELHANYLESHLLDQVRVVWSGQVFPLWVNKSICVFTKIGKVEPPNSCVSLEQLTEVIVAPKTRPGGSSQNIAASHASIEGRSALNADPIPGGSLNKSPTKTVGASNFDKHMDTNMGQRGWDVPLTGTDSTYQRPPSSQDGDLVNSFFNYLKSWLIGDKTEAKAEDKCAVLWQHDLEVVARVQSLGDSKDLYAEKNVKESKTAGLLGRDLQLDDLKGEQTEEQQTYYGANITAQPTTLYIAKSTLLQQRKAQTVDYPKVFLASMKKLLSPAEKEVDIRESAKNLKTKLASARGQSDSKDALPEEAKTLSQNSVVRVIVLDLEGLGDYNENVVTAKLGGTGSISRGHVMVSNELRRQLGLERTSRVWLQALHNKPHEVLSIMLHPLFVAPDGFTSDMLVIAFKCWLYDVSSTQCPLVVTQGTLVRCFIKQDFYGEFLITYDAVKQGQTEGPVYCLLSWQICEEVKVTVGPKVTETNKPDCITRLPFWRVEDFDPKVPIEKLSHLGGVSAEAKKALAHLEICLAQRPLTHKLFDSTPGMCNGGVLICGPKGVGKSTLSRALCVELCGPPSLAYIQIIDCKSLKGKRPETIGKTWEKAFNEAYWRQPSVILLDDLDQVTAAASGPEQEATGEAQYYSRVAGELRAILCREMFAKSRITVLATSKSRSSLQPILVSSRGAHVFQQVVDIKPPNQTQRKEILKLLLHSKIVVSMETANQLNLDALARKTEGYVARDLDAVVDKAIHAHLMTESEPPIITAKTKHGEIFLTDEDFRKSLEGFTPASLRNIPLHTSEDTGWKDVGGLKDVSRALVETLEWPSKYPVLFANCPLRLRSGLLLYGAPGTGKTLLAGVVAKECGLNFISIKGPELLSKYIGASEQAVRDTFERAQSAKPCILFFDEFDSLAPRRGHDSTGVTDRVVNQLLTQLDGVEGLEGVYVLAATSRPDLIDPALLRPGRLDKALHCGLPTKEERLEIIEALTRKMNLADDVDLPNIAARCEHFTGADFKALLYNAQLEAIHEANGHVIKSDSYKNPNGKSWEIVGDQLDIINSGHSIPQSASMGNFGQSADPSHGGISWESQTPEGSTGLLSQPSSPTGLPPAGSKGLQESPKESDSHRTDRGMVTEKTDIDGKIEIAYIPSLEEGVVELEPSRHQKLTAEVEVIKSNFNSQENSKTAPEKPVVMATQVRQHHLEKAVCQMRPSVSPAERMRYQKIYENFIGSRGGNFSEVVTSGGKRTTLA